MRLAIFGLIYILVGCRYNHVVSGKVTVEGGTVHEIKSLCIEENGFKTVDDRKACIEALMKCGDMAKEQIESQTETD